MTSVYVCITKDYAGDRQERLLEGHGAIEVIDRLVRDKTVRELLSVRPAGFDDLAKLDNAKNKGRR